MLGGTNGAHLTSFSLIDILSHGRACGMLNPYYTVFFSPAVQDPLRLVDSLGDGRGNGREGRALGEAVAGMLMDFERQVMAPVRLADVPGFTDAHIERALAAAKNPQLRMKLENMPVPLSPETVDDYMGPVLEAAKTGDLRGIRTV
jgi:alcohol dehydrogenase